MEFFVQDTLGFAISTVGEHVNRLQNLIRNSREALESADRVVIVIQKPMTKSNEKIMK